MSINRKSLDKFYNDRKIIDEGFLADITGKAPLSKDSDYFPKSKVLSDARNVREKTNEKDRPKLARKVIFNCIHICNCAISYGEEDEFNEFLPKYEQGTLPDLITIFKLDINQYRADILDKCNKAIIDLKNSINKYNKQGTKAGELHAKMSNLRIKDLQKGISIINSIHESVDNLTEQQIQEYIDELNITNEKMDMDEGYGAKLRPVFIVLTYSDSTFAKSMNKIFKDEKSQTYWHVSLGFGPSLSRLYSFNNNKNTHTNKHKGGLSFESYEYYNKLNPDGIMEVNCIFVTNEKYKALKKSLEYYIENKEKTRYDSKNILWMYLNKVTKNKDHKPNLVCSTFVNAILSSIGVNLSDKEANLIMPDDLRKKDSNEKQFKLYEGKIGEFNAEKMAEQVNKLADNVSNDYFKNKKKETTAKNVSESVLKIVEANKN